MNDRRHPIQVVARRTGLSADVLRAWEKRYRAVEPRRTASGRRTYSDADVDRLRLLKRITRGGRSIGQVATLPTDELARLVQEDAAQAATAGPRAAEEEIKADAAQLGRQALAAVVALDAAGLEAVLSRALLALGAAELVDEVAVPLLQQVGARWEAGRLGIAHEHLASVVVRRVLGGLFAAGGEADAPALVAATPQGEHHEFGALLAGASAAALGWHVTYLGADLPAADIAAAARAQQARAVALSLVCPTPDADLEGELVALHDGLAGSAAILVGGPASQRVAATLEAIDAVRLENFAALRAYLARRRSEVATR